MAARTRPYLFYDVAISICSTCYRKVDAQDRLRGRPRAAAEALPRARPRARADRRRRRLLPALPRGLPQAAGDAAALQHAGEMGLPVRLRPVHRSRAALVPLAGRDLRLLQPALSDLLRGERPRSPARSAALDQIERMLDAVVAQRRASPTSCRSRAASRRCIPTSSASSTWRKARPIRHLMVNTNGIRIAESEAFAERLAGYMPDFEVYLQFDSFERDALIALRGADLRAVRAAGARAAEPPRHLDHAGGDAEERAERPRDRPDHRLRAAAAVRARRHVPAGAGTPGALDGFDPATRPADADRSAPAHPRADAACSARRTSSRCRAIPTRWRWPTRSRSTARWCR